MGKRKGGVGAAVLPSFSLLTFNCAILNRESPHMQIHHPYINTHAHRRRPGGAAAGSALGQLRRHDGQALRFEEQEGRRGW